MLQKLLDKLNLHNVDEFSKLPKKERVKILSSLLRDDLEIKYKNNRWHFIQSNIQFAFEAGKHWESDFDYLCEDPRRMYIFGENANVYNLGKLLERSEENNSMEKSLQQALLMFGSDIYRFSLQAADAETVEDFQEKINNICDTFGAFTKSLGWLFSEFQLKEENPEK